MHKKIIGLVLLLAVFVIWAAAYFMIFPIAESEMKTISLRITSDSNTDKIKAFTIRDWITDNIDYVGGNRLSAFNLLAPFGFRNAQTSFLLRQGYCEEFAEIFTIMSKDIGLPARLVATDGEVHAWVEVYSNGKWNTFDPYLKGRNASYGYSGFYEDINYWTDGNYPKRLSYVYYLDENGQKTNITQKYTVTGELLIKIKKDENVQASIIEIKSHHLMEAIPKDFPSPITTFIGNTNKAGLFDINLGGNNYTIIAKKEIIPFVLSEYGEKEIHLEEGKITELELELNKKDFEITNILFLVCFSFLILIIFSLIKAIKNNSGKKY